MVYIKLATTTMAQYMYKINLTYINFIHNTNTVRIEAFRLELNKYLSHFSGRDSKTVLANFKYD